MSRKFVIAVAISAIVASATLVQADGPIKRGWDNFWAATMRNNAWPEAFVPFDRAAARAPFGGCVAAGWRVLRPLPG